MYSTLAVAAITLAAACATAPPTTTPPEKPPEKPPETVERPAADNLGPVPTPQRTVLDNERVCVERSDLWGCTIAGVFYHSGDEAEHIAVDVPKAVRYLERGCGGRIAEACAMLILIYGGGEPGVAQDLDRVNRLHMQLCGDGFEDHCKQFKAPVLE